MLTARICYPVKSVSSQSKNPNKFALMFWGNWKSKALTVSTVALAGFFAFQAGKYYLRSLDAKAELAKDPQWLKGQVLENAANDLETTQLFLNCDEHSALPSFDIPGARRHLFSAAQNLKTAGFREMTIQEIKELQGNLTVSNMKQASQKVDEITNNVLTEAKKHFDAAPQNLQADAHGLTIGSVLAAVMAFATAFFRWAYSKIYG